MLQCSGSTQALVLRCLVSVLENSSASKLKMDQIDEDVLSVIFELCASETITTQKSALQLASAVIGSDGVKVDVKDAIERAKGKLGMENGWEILVSKGAYFHFILSFSHLTLKQVFFLMTLIVRSLPWLLSMRLPKVKIVLESFLKCLIRAAT